MKPILSYLYVNSSFIYTTIQLLDICLYYKDCPNTELVENGVCNDESNNAECNFDGGDCITTTMAASTTTISALLTTHDPGNCIPYA